MGDRFVRFEPGSAIALSRQETARSRNIRDGVVREAESFGSRLEEEKRLLAQQIADETGVRIITDLHLESLTVGPPAASYIDMMKHNVTLIVEALK